MSLGLCSRFSPSWVKRVVSSPNAASNTLVKRHKAMSHKLGSGLNRQQVRSVYSINKITLLGYAGGDPQTHTFGDGTSVTSFSLAVSENYVSKKTGEKVDRTDWFRVSVHHEKLQELVTKMVHKGSRVYVEGALRPRKWTDATGVERTSMEVLVRAKGEVVVVGKSGELDEHGMSSSHNSHEPL